MRHILGTFITYSLVCIHQKTKIAAKIASANGPVLQVVCFLRYYTDTIAMHNCGTTVNKIYMVWKLTYSTIQLIIYVIVLVYAKSCSVLVTCVMCIVFYRKQPIATSYPGSYLWERPWLGLVT